MLPVSIDFHFQKLYCKHKIRNYWIMRKLEILKKFVKNQNFKIMKNMFYMLCNFTRRWYVVNFKMIWEELTSEMTKRWFSQIWPPVDHFECCIMGSYTRHTLRVTAICHISFIMIPVAIQKLYRVNTNCVTDRQSWWRLYATPKIFWGA